MSVACVKGSTTLLTFFSSVREKFTFCSTGNLDSNPNSDIDMNLYAI